MSTGCPWIVCYFTTIMMCCKETITHKWIRPNCIGLKLCSEWNVILWARLSINEIQSVKMAHTKHYNVWWCYRDDTNKIKRNGRGLWNESMKNVPYYKYLISYIVLWRDWYNLSQSLSWRQKFRHDIKKYIMTLNKFVITFKTGHDVKKFRHYVKSTSWRHTGLS